MKRALLLGVLILLALGASVSAAAETAVDSTIQRPQKAATETKVTATRTQLPTMVPSATRTQLPTMVPSATRTQLPTMVPTQAATASTDASYWDANCPPRLVKRSGTGYVVSSNFTTGSFYITLTEPGKLYVGDSLVYSYERVRGWVVIVFTPTTEVTVEASWTGFFACSSPKIIGREFFREWAEEEKVPNAWAPMNVGFVNNSVFYPTWFVYKEKDLAIFDLWRWNDTK